MHGWIDSLNAHSADWAAWIWRASWQAAVVISVAWVLTILLRRQSPRLRSWIWRLAYLKLLVLLVWTTPVRLPLLPAAEESGRWSVASGQNHNAASAGRTEVQTDAPSRLESQESGVGSQFHKAVTAAEDPPGRGRAEVQTDAPIKPADFHWQSLLLLSWLLGIVLVITWLVWETARAAKLRRSVRLINQPELQTILSEVCQQLGLRSSVQIGESNLAGSPLLVKFLKPTIVFPAGVLDVAVASSRREYQLSETNRRLEAAATLSPDEIRLVLAHELAHIKRHDLAWNALSAAVNVCLYFHPLVWLAHRWARQEQEMSCDELVVTRLGVERHEYGQMLVKVVRRLGRNLPTGMAVVGMASSYRTLSMRIEAMKRFRQFTGRQIALAACGLALIGLLAIIPWQVVAQDQKQTSKPTVSSGIEKQVDSGETPEAQGLQSPGLPDDKASIKKLLVGTWKSGYHPSDELVLHDDGSFERNYRTWIASGDNATLSGYQSQQGRWTIGDRKIQKQPGKEEDIPTLNLEILHDGPYKPLWTQPDKVDALYAGSDRDRWYGIERLDKEFLRLKIHEGPQAITSWNSDKGQVTFLTSPMMFYRRVDTNPERVDKNPQRQAYDPKLPEELRRVAAIAQLTPEEAITLDEISSGPPRASGFPNPAHALLDKANVELLERIDAARHHKIGFAQLFKLNDAEVAAFCDLMRQVDDGYDTAQTLDKDSLTKDELSGLEKLNDARQRLGTLKFAIDGNVGLGNPPKKSRGPVIVKTTSCINELADWLESTVYNVAPATQAGFGPGGAGLGSGGFRGGGF